tara:strand:- start:941 stop:1426 length:486 start_codon:yes stop_codon:yes gene_type:complete
VSQINQKLENYIFGYLSKPNFRFYNNMHPCPYAKKSWLSNNVEIKNVDNVEDYWDKVVDECERFDGTKEVVILTSEKHPCNVQQLLGGCEALNIVYAKQNKDIWLLSSQDEWTMILIQKLSMLDDASLSLESQGYYNMYDKNAYKNFVLKRRKIRKYLTRT